MRITVALALIALMIWIASPASSPVDRALVLGTAIHVGNLSVWPILAEELPEVGEFRSLEQAQARSELGVSECEEAEVGSLLIENRGDVPILACAGVVFVGGKQDRQLGEDVVVAAHSTTSVRAFCVEQNRWAGGGSFDVEVAQAARTVRVAAQYQGDQAAVWRGVAEARASIGLDPGSYRAVMTGNTEFSDKVAAHLRAQRGNLVGYAYAINGRVLGIRTFAHPALLDPQLDAMIRAVCAESAQSGSWPVDIAQDGPRAAIYLRMASDAYDDGDLAMAETQARRVLELDPQNEAAQQLCRGVRPEVSPADLRAAFNEEWRTIMARLEYSACPSPTILNYPEDWDDTGVDRRGLGGTEQGPLAVLDDVSSGLDGSGDPGLFFNDGSDGAFRGVAEATFRATGESKRVGTNGMNRNDYRRTATGHRASCAVRDKNGRWLTLTRDWSAR